jgi:hypothetical protein
VLGEHLQEAKARGKSKVSPKAVKQDKQIDPPTRGAIATLVSKHYRIAIDEADRITAECFAMK